MQATDCRRAFPCWDEPEFKAVFAVTLDVEEGLTAISNSPEVERSTEHGRHVIRFADTMAMCSYLVAFVVGGTERPSRWTVDATPSRLVHVPGKGTSPVRPGRGASRFAGSRSTTTDRVPIGAKLDLIAIPDFAAGAMENLGASPSARRLLLVDPATTPPTPTRLAVADVVGTRTRPHVVRRSGDDGWWNGLWLNEAFATFMEIAGCAAEAYRPEWQRWTAFGVTRQSSTELDARARARSSSRSSPPDADGMFDVLTYQRAGRMLCMLEQYLGPEVSAPVWPLPNAHELLATLRPADLWDATERDERQPMPEHDGFGWIFRPGYPLMTRRSRTECSTLRQTPFPLPDDCEDDGARRRTARWPILIRVRSGDGGVQTLRCCSTEQTPCRCPPTVHRARARLSTPAGTASTASPTATTFAVGSMPRNGRVAVHARALQPRRRRVGGHARRADVGHRVARLPASVRVRVA